MEARLFFEFLQVTIGNRESLSCELSDNEWHDIFLLLKKHALLGVGFTALERLHAKGVVCPPQLRMQFGSGDRYIDSLMRKASDLVTVRNDYFRHGGTRLFIKKTRLGCVMGMA